MKPIGVLYEHPGWFKLLFGELERRGISYEKLYVDEHWRYSAPVALPLIPWCDRRRSTAR
jgi:hypothetical protein